MSPAGYNHGTITLRLAARLFNYVDIRKLGDVTAAETGFVIQRNPDTVRAPDVAFVSKDRVPVEGGTTRFFPGVPDLAVETMSPYDTVSEIDEKAHEWLNAGTRLVWVVNPREKTATVYRPNITATILTVSESLNGGDVIPGFEMPIADLFGS
jgi:Uma2 family endonuclease